MTTRKIRSARYLTRLALAGMVIGSAAMLGCKKTMEPDQKDALQKFIEECEAKGDSIETHDTCNGTGSCKGTSFDSATGDTTVHDCKAMNTCAGATCLTADDEVVEATPLEKFVAACEAEGKTVEQNDCKGLNTCKGTSFDVATSMEATHDCKAMNSCKGANCLEPTEVVEATPLEKFVAACEAEGKTVEQNDCKGLNTCKGTSFDVATSMEASHDCKAMNSCKGANCLEPTEVVEATPLERFIADCEAAGKTVEQNSCNGQGSCAGTSFNEATGATAEHVCAGYNTCKGASCKA